MAGHDPIAAMLAALTPRIAEPDSAVLLEWRIA